MMVTGSFNFPSPGKTFSAVELLWLLSFVFIIFFFLTNFFLAIVVDGYAKVSRAVEENDAENSIVVDLVDSVLSAIQHSKSRWPPPNLVLQYLLRDQGFELRVDTTNHVLTLEHCLELNEALPLVTAEELASPKVALMSLEQAKHYVCYYMSAHKKTGSVTPNYGTPSAIEEQTIPATINKDADRKSTVVASPQAQVSESREVGTHASMYAHICACTYVRKRAGSPVCTATERRGQRPKGQAWATGGTASQGARGSSVV